MAYTPTSIANLALGHLGDRHIDDIDDANSTDAEIIRDYYDHSVALTFISNDWQWAQREAQLQRLPGAPVTRWSYYYQLPPAFSRPSVVCEDSEMRRTLDEIDGQWKIMSGKFATSAEDVFMHYVANDWDESAWVPHFAECVGLKLAALSAPRITHNQTQRTNLEKLFEDSVTMARITDGQFQTTRPRIIRSQWARDRFSRGVRSARPDIS
jgi:hypothetical protein